MSSFRPLRRGRRSWHQAAGRILIPVGLLTALTGLWMAAFYALPPTDGLILLILRLVFGTAMLANIALAIFALRHRDFARHGAWMTRAYGLESQPVLRPSSSSSRNS